MFISNVNFENDIYSNFQLKDISLNAQLLTQCKYAVLTIAPKITRIKNCTWKLLLTIIY